MGLAADMSGFLRKFSHFYHRLLMKCLTNTEVKAPNLLEIRKIDVPLQSINKRFKAFARDTLPGGATVSGFRREGYIGGGQYGPERRIHELLVDLEGRANEKFFTEISKNKQGAEADSHLVFKALDYARLNNLFPVAINIYLESAYNYEFINSVLDYLQEHNIAPESLVLELLEYDAPGTNDDLSALGYARENGLRFALDDFDPRRDMERLERLAEYCSFLKFDKKVLWDFQAGHYDELPEVFRTLRARYPGLRFIGEGITPDFVEHHPELDFDATQKSGWGDLGL
jgi:hypothetical protein